MDFEFGLADAVPGLVRRGDAESYGAEAEISRPSTGPRAYGTVPANHDRTGSRASSTATRSRSGWPPSSC